MPKRLPSSSSRPELCTGIYVVCKGHGPFSLFYSILSGWPLYIVLQPSVLVSGEEVSDGSYFRCLWFCCFLGLFSRCVLGLLPHRLKDYALWQPYQCSLLPIPLIFGTLGSSLCLLKCIWHAFIFLSVFPDKWLSSTERDCYIPTAKNSVRYVTGV